MKRILVATDFSTRSDRAIRRATLLARTFEASLTLLHVVDDNQPLREVEAEHRRALVLLSKLSNTLRDVDGVNNDFVISTGNVIQEIQAAAHQLDPDVVIVGTYRRQILLDMFLGTTAERTIRESPRPILMANAVPAVPYRHVLVGVDLSQFSGEILQTVAQLGLGKNAVVSVLHVVEIRAAGPILSFSLTGEEIPNYRAESEKRAASEFSAFLRNVKFTPFRQILKLPEGSIAETIRSVAAELAVDLVVVGVHGHTGAAKLQLGSVTDNLLKASDCDVMAVPSSAPRAGQ